MKTGTHIPAYLLCERFGQKGKVVDLYPPDEEGSKLLTESSELAVVVQRSAQDFDFEKSTKLKRLVADPDQLPFSKGNFDLVLILEPEAGDGKKGLDSLIRAARGLVNPSGVLMVQIPNREARGLDTNIDKNYPDFLDFERGLRKHFPHVMLFSKQPLHGGVIAPLGRRPNSDGPILDDRLLPKNGEPASHFIAICSTRFRRTDDTIIAQLPFQNLAEQVRSRIEKLEGTIGVVRNENEARGRELELAEKRVSELQENLSDTKRELRDRATMSSSISRLEETLRQREQLLAEAEENLESQLSELSAKSDQLHSAERRVRTIEKQIADLERMGLLASKERDEAELERQRVVTSLHETQSELHSKQREIDDLVERLAGMETEMSSLLKEASNQRRDLVQAREHNRALSLRIDELEHSTLSSPVIEKEIERMRTQILSEKKRAEDQLEREHRQVLEEISAKETARREVHRLEVELRESNLGLESKTAQNQRFVETQKRLAEKTEILEAERDELLQRLRQSEESMAELGRLSEQNSGDLGRKDHTINMLEERALEAEKRAEIMDRRSSELHDAVSAAESKIALMEEAAAKVSLDHKQELESLRAELQQKLQTEIENTDSEKESELQQKILEGKARIDQLTNEHRAQLLEIEQQHIIEVERLEQSHSASMEKCEKEHLTELEQREVVHSVAIRKLNEIRDELDHVRPNANAAQISKSRAEAAEAAVEDLKNLNRETEGKLAETTAKMRKLKSDLTQAMEALADSEEDAEVMVQTAAERIHAMKAELIRLTEENETELLAVREDLESELRHSNAQLEARQGEIWELREEVIRLQALAAATAASAEKKGAQSELQQTLIDQENLITDLTKERDSLREQCEKLSGSLEVRRKNLKIIATLLRKERRDGSPTQTQADPLDDDWSKNTSRSQLVTRELDIKSLIAEAGGEVGEGFDQDFDDDDENAKDTSDHISSFPPEASIKEYKDVDSVMDSVVLDPITGKKDTKKKQPS